MTTWMPALGGGVLIGLAATLLLWLNGRVAGVSGILGGVLLPSRGDVGWRVAFLVGLVAGAGAWFALVPGAFAPRTGFPPALLVVAGVLVGSRMGNGRTSGHGICGLARFSGRSLAAVLTFMATAMATTSIAQNWSPG